MRVVVTGGRYYGVYNPETDPPERKDVALEERFNIYETLYDLHRNHTISFIGQGGAPGADHWANLWASSYNINRKTWKADWETHGKAAGPIRNGVMLREANPDLVIAFPGGRGTDNCVKQAKEINIKVMDKR